MARGDGLPPSPSRPACLLLLLLLTFTLLDRSRVEGHGRLLEPPSRATMWRYGFDVTADYDDNQGYCGGKSQQWQRYGGRCGVCGDPWRPVPRPHERGGRYYDGTPVRYYVTGDVIDVVMAITANHRGWVEFRLCPYDPPDPHPHHRHRQQHDDDLEYDDDGRMMEVSQACLDRHLLQLADGSGTRFYLPEPYRVGQYRVAVRLPPGLACRHCLLQWKWNVANSWGTDPDGTSCLGCGEQEQFYACADIVIESGGWEGPSSPPYPHPPVHTRPPPPTSPLTTSPSPRPWYTTGFTFDPRQDPDDRKGHNPWGIPVGRGDYPWEEEEGRDWGWTVPVALPATTAASRDPDPHPPPGTTPVALPATSAASRDPDPHPSPGTTPVALPATSAASRDRDTHLHPGTAPVALPTTAPWGTRAVDVTASSTVTESPRSFDVTVSPIDVTAAPRVTERSRSFDVTASPRVTERSRSFDVTAGFWSWLLRFQPLRDHSRPTLLPGTATKSTLTKSIPGTPTLVKSIPGKSTLPKSIQGAFTLNKSNPGTSTLPKSILSTSTLNKSNLGTSTLNKSILDTSILDTSTLNKSILGISTLTKSNPDKSTLPKSMEGGSRSSGWGWQKLWWGHVSRDLNPASSPKALGSMLFDEPSHPLPSPSTPPPLGTATATATTTTTTTTTTVTMGKTKGSLKQRLSDVWSVADMLRKLSKSALWTTD